MTKWEPPTTKNQVCKIMGVFGFFRVYVLLYSEIANTLTDLTGKWAPIWWFGGEWKQLAFEELRRRLCFVPVLYAAEVGKPWFVETDASGVAVAACVGQWDTSDNERPVAYPSAKLSSTQRAWSTIEREAYTVIWALNRFEDLLFQAKITLFCDHNPLRYEVDCDPKSAKLTRLAMQEHDIMFNYRKGKLIVVANRLSRVGFES